MGTPTLRWYLTKQFFVGVLGAFFLCAVLIFMIDFIEMLRRSGGQGEVKLDRVIRLTLLRLPSYTELLFTFAVLVASIGTLINLNRKNELAVMRAGGMSVWQFIAPGIVVALFFGIFGVLVYNPFAAASRAKADELFAKYYGKESNFLKMSGGGNWLRQDSVDGPSAIHGAAATQGGLQLTVVTAFRFSPDGNFRERISGESAVLKDRYWHIQDAWVVAPGKPPEFFKDYLLSTYLSPEKVRDALDSVTSVSIWELPDLIDLAKKAGLPASQYEIALHLLLARPFLLMAMVLLGATVSLRSFRSGGVQNMVIVGVTVGVGFFLGAELSRQVGLAGLIAPWVAVWVPVGVAWLFGLTVLLHQEDG
ncbi:MAG: LPS export ABC transporter permease LptG [Pseudomonadota bacterium]